jgi:ubiquinone/menaquinone biosynthesis C-methylase UbiE
MDETYRSKSGNEELQVAEADRITQELWKLDVSVWSRYWAPIFAQFAEGLILDANLKEGQIILDVGTGTGVAAFEAANCITRGFVFGIDRSRDMIAVALATKTKLSNTSFIMMNGHQMLFPDRLFDRVLSNCGISYGTYPETLAEIYRVMQKGAKFVFTDWYLIDVPAHRTFNEILRRHRTEHPSRKLQKWREALSTLEMIRNRYSEPRKQQLELRKVGFERITQQTRDYKIHLRNVQAYLRMRLDRASVKRELIELAPTKRADLMHALATELRRYVHNDQFMIDWKVKFTRATKPK